jgi:hypothetical protein
VDEADLWEQRAQVPASEDDYPHEVEGKWSWTDPLVDVAIRIWTDAPDSVTLAHVMGVVDRCRDELDAPNAAVLPELVERLARERLGEGSG